MRVVILGCGYVGLPLAERWAGESVAVTTLTRSDSRQQTLAAHGISSVVGNVLNPTSLDQLPEADVCLYAIGYDRNAGESKEEVYVNGLRNVLNVISNRIPKLVYISSTSVYGQSSGELVDENSPATAETDSGRICLAAEAVVREWSEDRFRTATILRLAGIYGPGRLIGRKRQLEQHELLPGNPNAWLNLVHRDDIVQVIDHLAKNTFSRDLYVLSDGAPIRRFEFYSELARLLQAPQPVMGEATETELGKRINPVRLLSEFPLKLRYPSIFSGLPASHDI